MQAWIEIAGKKTPLVGELFIGRLAGNHVVVDHGSVSRRHAMVYEDGGRYYIADFGSRNGLYRNGVRVTAPSELRDKDKIQIGEAAMLFRWPGQPRRADAAAMDFASQTIEIRRGVPAAVRRHVVVLDEEMRLTHTNADWDELMKRFFHASPEPYSGLVPRMKTWVQRAKETLSHSKLSAVEPLIAQEGAQRVVARAELGPRGTLVLIVTEEGTAFDPTQLKSLGLSPREAEVMRWISEGKTNSDIGSILELSVSTVNKHVEHILAKLGVENRSQAILEVLERLGRG